MSSSKPPLSSCEQAIVELQQQLAMLRHQVANQSRITAAQYRRELLADSRFADPLRLERYGFKVWSQNDEDGYLQETFRRLAISHPSFMEIGVEQGLECNTHFLLAQGASGVWIEASKPSCDEIAQRFHPYLRNGRLKLANAQIEPENINSLCEHLKIPTEIDLLSIDIDGHDYYVWQALTAIRPKVVVIEYNSKLPPPASLVQPYRRGVAWDGTDGFGASLASLVKLGTKLGYCLVGCEIVGSNAFFVRQDLVGELFQRPFTAENHYHPCRYELILAGAFIVGHRATATDWVRID